MRILIFTWRDIKNPRAGGAEVVTHEVGKRWVKWGHEVTVFTAMFKDGRSDEVVDGVRIIRAGNDLSVYLHAWREYRRHFKGKFDVVIEQANGYIPWYCFYYVEEPLIALRHQNGRSYDEFNPRNSVAYYELPPGIRLFAYIWEPYTVKYLTKFPILAMSNSTKNDFIDLKSDPDNIFVVPEGIKFTPVDRIGQKETDPTFLYVGRLTAAKRVEHVLEAVSRVKTSHPEVKLWIIGSGKPRYVAKLKNLTRKLNIADSTRFYGYLDENDKRTLMKRAHALIITSIREGWGLVVTEANAMGTPAIGYDVAGLRDSIRHGKTGLLVENGDIEALGRTMEKFIEDERLRNNLTENALDWSRKFSWDRSARVIMNSIEGILDRINNGM